MTYILSVLFLDICYAIISQISCHFPNRDDTITFTINQTGCYEGVRLLCCVASV